MIHRSVEVRYRENEGSEVLGRIDVFFNVDEVPVQEATGLLRVRKEGEFDKVYAPGSWSTATTKPQQ